ncbi:hypothetical protein MRBLBA21_003765 [Peribacillus frigoritolerans]|uniref:hypothetical protein n=1 Tax=Peribacillus frigoritolerans TaxID=450367 RepID=UPI0034392B8C
MDILLEFLKILKNQKYLTVALIVLIIVNIISFFSNLEKITSLYKIMGIISKNGIYLLYIIILAIIFINILRYSHKKSQPREEDFYNKNTHCEVEIVNSVSGNIKISRSYSGYEFQIDIKNISNEDILNVDGFISIYNHKVRIKKFPFEVNILKPGYSESIYHSVNEFALFNFENFDIYINEIKTKSGIKKGIYEVSLKRVNRFYKILNMERFIDYKLFGLKTRYNLVWFKQKSREVFSRFQFLCRKRIYGRQNLFLEVCSFIKRRFIFISVYTIILFLFCITLLAVIKTLYMFWELIPFLWELIKEVTKK